MPTIHTKMQNNEELEKSNRIDKCCEILRKHELELRDIETPEIHNYIRNIQTVDSGYLAVMMARHLHGKVPDDVNPEIIDIVRKCQLLMNLRQSVLSETKVTRSGRPYAQPNLTKKFRYSKSTEDGIIYEDWDSFKTKDELLDLTRKFCEYSNWPRVQSDPDWPTHMMAVHEAENEVRSWKNDPTISEAGEQTAQIFDRRTAYKIVKSVFWIAAVRRPVYRLEMFHIKNQLETEFGVAQVDIAIPTADVVEFDELQEIFFNIYQEMF